MARHALVSIIICTCTHAQDLRQTLKSIGKIEVSAELLVVDNASTDNTKEVAQTCGLPNMPVRYIHEARKGKGYAYTR